MQNINFKQETSSFGGHREQNSDSKYKYKSKLILILNVWFTFSFESSQTTVAWKDAMKKSGSSLHLAGLHDLLTKCNITILPL